MLPSEISQFIVDRLLKPVGAGNLSRVPEKVMGISNKNQDHHQKWKEGEVLSEGESPPEEIEWSKEASAQQSSEMLSKGIKRPQSFADAPCFVVLVLKLQNFSHKYKTKKI